MTREPETEAGRDLLDHSVQYSPEDAERSVTAAKIADVEREARAAVLAELRAGVEGLDGHPSDFRYISRYAVLRLIADAEEHRE